MSYDNLDGLDNSAKNTLDDETDVNIVPSEDKDPKVRKRIDELLEKKRLRALLDDSEDWDV